MSSLKKLLKAKGYHKIKITQTATRHLEVKAKINGVDGIFIIDTGASSTCVGFDAIQHFQLLAEDSEIRAAGAGSTNLLTQTSLENKLEIRDWVIEGVSLVLFDLKHINEALMKYKAEPIHGIIGSDVLNAGDAILDYANMRLYLK